MRAGGKVEALDLANAQTCHNLFESTQVATVFSIGPLSYADPTAVTQTQILPSDRDGRSGPQQPDRSTGLRRTLSRLGFLDEGNAMSTHRS